MAAADRIEDRTGSGRGGERPSSFAQSLRAAMGLVAVVAIGAALVGLSARATNGARTSGDEPQYLLTATSLAEDGDLDIADEIATAAYLDYHEVPIDPQTARRADGTRVSPHDPLLPLLLAGPMAVGGWVAAKATLALVAGATAALTLFAAVRRLDLAVAPSTIVVGLAFAGVPLAPYGTQVYPELPAALALTVAVVALTSPRIADRPTASVVALLAIVALPWLAVKYTPVAAVAGVSLLVRIRADRRAVVALTGVALAAGAAYLVAHQAWYGGWTVYASGDHFVETGEFAVVGTEVDLIGRSRRLTGLLVDGSFGLVAWAPLWGLLPLAVGRAMATWRGGPPLRSVATATLGAAWMTATFVALTMHGWWVPGRQLVVALPMAVLLVAAWVDGSGRRLRLATLLGLVGVLNWVWLAIEASTGRRTLIVDFADTGAPGFRLLSRLLADGTAAGGGATALLAGWSIIVVAAMAAGTRDRPSA